MPTHAPVPTTKRINKTTDKRIRRPAPSRGNRGKVPKSKGDTGAVPHGVAASDAPSQTVPLLDFFTALDEAKKSEFRAALSPIETLVFEQIVTPNHEAWLYVIADQAWDEATDCIRSGPVHLRFEYEHMARGLEMDLAFFERVTACIRRKFISYLETGQAFEYMDYSMLRRFEAVFGLRPIALSINVTAVRRLLTITARDQMEKVTGKVAGMLKAFGAQVPSPVPPVSNRAHPAQRRADPVKRVDDSPRYPCKTSSSNRSKRPTKRAQRGPLPHD